MQFRSTPPDPAEFPRIRLLWPIAAPAAILIFVLRVEGSGHHLGISGEGALVIAAFYLALAIGAIASIVSLSSLLPALRQHETLRTRANLFCVAASLAFVVVAVGAIVATAINLSPP
ncbi:MAG: hypothetical protein U5L05_04350 [Rubrivivax sp.]|nr:hypothetical protein [Rubrivivax sp.]